MAGSRRRGGPALTEFEWLQEEHAALQEELAGLSARKVAEAEHEAYIERVRAHMARLRRFQETLRPGRA